MAVTTTFSACSPIFVHLDDWLDHIVKQEMVAAWGAHGLIGRFKDRLVSFAVS
jgi:hypothetical protein